MNEKNQFINSLLAVAKEWQKIALIKECRKDFERGADETPMEVSNEENSDNIKTEIKEEPDLQLEVYEDKEYDIEEVKYWNFVAKKRAPKPDIIRTLVYKVPEIPSAINAKTLINQQKSNINSSTAQNITNIVSPITPFESKIKSNSDIQITSTTSTTTTINQTPQITRVLSSSTNNTNNTTNNLTNKSRLNTLNLTALDMAHYNSNKTSANYDYDQLDILKSNPIGTYSQHYNNIKNENKYNDKRPNRRLPDEIQPLKSIQQELNTNDQKANKINNKKKNYLNDKFDKPKVVIEIDDPAPAGVKIVTRSRTTSRGRNNSNTNVNNKRSSNAYDLRQIKRKVVNYNENDFSKNNDLDVYNFCDSNNDIDDLESHLRDNSQDIDNFMDYTEDTISVTDKVNDEDEDDELDLINEKIDKNDADFDVRLERKKMKSKNKALKSTTTKSEISTSQTTTSTNVNNTEKPKRQRSKTSQQNVNIYSKVYKTSSTSKVEEPIPNNADLNIPDDMRVTRRLSLRRASLNRASSNSNELIIKKEEQLLIDDSDSNSYKGSKSKVANSRRSLQPSKINRKFSKDSNSSSDLNTNRRASIRLSRSDTQNTDTDETLSTNSSIKPKRKYRSYLAVLTDEERAALKAKEEERNKELLESYKIKHGVDFKVCHVTLQRAKLSKDITKNKIEIKEVKENNLNKSEPNKLIELKEIEKPTIEATSVTNETKLPEQDEKKSEPQKEIDNSINQPAKEVENRESKTEKIENKNMIKEHLETKSVESLKIEENKSNKSEDNQTNQSLNETLNTSTASTETRRSARLTRSKAKLLDKN